MEEETDSYYYETKCRRCGYLTKWYVASFEILSLDSFLNVMRERIKEAGVQQCGKCKMETVQDVVSHTSIRDVPIEKRGKKNSL